MGFGSLGFGDDTAVQLINQLFPVICGVFLGLGLARFCWGIRGFFCLFFLFAWFLTHSPFDPLGGTLKQNVQLIKFQSCKTLILGIKAYALGNI